MSSTQAASNSGPGYAKHPEHKLNLVPCEGRVHVVSNGETVADTTQALVMQEGDYAPRYYIPRADVRGDLVTSTDTETYCPFKGRASYWSFTVDGTIAEDAAWSYEDPYDEMLGITGYFSFYEERVDALTVESPG